MEATGRFRSKGKTRWLVGSVDVGQRTATTEYINQSLMDDIIIILIPMWYGHILLYFVLVTYSNVVQGILELWNLVAI